MANASTEIPSPPIGPGTPVKCDRYYTEKNQTFFIYGGYEGIPENLLINTIIWLVLLILFAFLRKLAWDYGRIALVSRAEARELIPFRLSRYNVWTSLFYGDHNNVDELRASQESLETQVHKQDTGFCSWIPAFFRIKDELILQKCGRDAIQYLTFQRYLLVYAAVVTLLSIAVVLPVNFQGDLEGTTQTFGHTTISNINTNSPTLWLHTVLAVVFLIIAILFMRHFSVNLQYEEDDQASRTLMISNIPKNKCSKNLMMQHFQEAYPEAPVQDIQFSYSISKLVNLDKQRTRAIEGLLNSDAIYKQTGKRPMMIPYPCGQCCCCQSCGCQEVDAIQYYAEKEGNYRIKVEAEKVNAFRDTLGIAFVTFEDDHVASRVQTDFKMSCKGAHNPMPSSISQPLNAYNWEVRYAPAPDNIYWENLSISPAVWWMRAISVNVILFLILFFLTTPSVFLNLMNSGGYERAVQELRSPILVQFVPALLLWIISSILPQIVYYSDYYCIGHWTRTAEHHAVMRKTYFFLILMVLILPSLGLTSAKALFEFLATRNDQIYKFRWQCIFIPDNGAFFVNYVITSAFIGMAAELIRLPELLLYAIKLACARSSAERTSIRKSVLWEFQFGSQYAWILCVFTVIMTYSIPCPLITPFGLVYLIFKHAVDRYNIYFAYAPSKIDKNIHASAINFVIIAVVLLQCSVLFFTVLRSDKVGAITIFAIVALFLTLVIFFGRICFGWFKGLSPIRYRKIKDGQEDVPIPVGEQKPFIPNVLLETQEGEVNHDAENALNATQSYGAVDMPDAQSSVNQATGQPYM